MDESKDYKQIEDVLAKPKIEEGDVNPWDMGLPEADTATELISQDRSHLDRLALHLKLANERQLKTTQSEEAADALFE